MHPCKWSLRSGQAPGVACRAGKGSTWEASVWSCATSGDRVPVQLVRVQLTLGCAVAVVSSSSAGGKEREIR